MSVHFGRCLSDATVSAAKQWQKIDCMGSAWVVFEKSDGPVWQHS
eukprot:SAG31_NODE_37388_length_304_cov_1.604878_1_plen_44_part_10